MAAITRAANSQQLISARSARRRPWRWSVWRFTVDCAGLQNAFDNAAEGDTITLQAGTLCGGNYQLPDHKAITFVGQDGAGFQPSEGGAVAISAALRGG